MARLLSIFVLFSFFLIACGDDTEAKTYLNHDGENNAAPLLDAGDYTAAARFPVSSLTSNTGNQIIEVEYYMVNLPNQTRVQIFEGGTATEPGTMVYDQNVTLDAQSNSWNTHVLSAPVTIGNEDLWIAVNFIQESENTTIGCDEGPAVANGDFFNDLANQWTTLRDFSDQVVTINWNIRAVIGE